MPVSVRCGVAYLEGEAHSCGSEPYGAALYLPTRLSGARRWALFGVVAGMLWAIIPWVTWGGLQSIRSAPLAIVTGGLTGVTLTFIFGPLLRSGRRLVMLTLGVLALPSGAFLFGALLSVLHFILSLPLDRPYLGRTAAFAPVAGGLSPPWQVC